MVTEALSKTGISELFLKMDREIVSDATTQLCHCSNSATHKHNIYEWVLLCPNETLTKIGGELDLACKTQFADPCLE